MCSRCWAYTMIMPSQVLLKQIMLDNTLFPIRRSINRPSDKTPSTYDNNKHITFSTMIQFGESQTSNGTGAGRLIVV